MSDKITATAWLPAKGPRPLELNSDPAPDEVVWIDVDEGAGATEIQELLRRWFWQELDLSVIQDLLERDPKPESPYLEVAPGVRTISGFAVRIAPGEPLRPPSKLPPVELRQLECLASKRWLITCWHATERYDGPNKSVLTGTRDWPGLGSGEIERAWEEQEGQTAGDIGILLLRQVVSTYPAMRKGLFETLNDWQVELAHDPDAPRIERQTLADMLGVLAVYYQRLTSFNPPTEDHATSWFADVTLGSVAQDVDDQTDKALSHVTALNDRVRSSLELLTSITLGQQLGRTQALEEKLTLVTAIFLVPTLVVGFFGANTQLPGKENWLGFTLMCLFIVSGGLMTYWAMTRLQGRN